MALLPFLMILVPALALYARSALGSFPSFDGAMSLNVARSLAAGHGYGFRYDGFFPFPAQTDGPVILPAALLFRLFGVGLATSQLVGLSYLVGFALVVTTVLRGAGLGPWPAAAGSLACLLTPGMGDYGINGYGEVPMVFWLLAGILAASRNRLGPAGLLLGLAVLTKQVALLGVVPVCLACAVHVLAGPDRNGLRTLAPLAAGLLLTLAGWELFRLLSLGGPAAWRQWWVLQLGQVGLQSGAAALAGPAAALAKLRLHLAVLSAAVGVPGPLLCGWLAVPWILAVHRLRRGRFAARGPTPSCALLLVGAAPCAVWWLTVVPTEMAWLRRILPGLLLQTCLIAVLAGTAATRPRSRAVLLALALLVLPGEALILRHGVGISPRAASATERRRVRLVADALRALPPDAVIFGVGWWQAPLFALLSGRTIMNLDLWDAARVNALPRAFFVVDQAAADLAGTRLREVWRTATLAPVLRAGDMALYRIQALDPDRPLADPAPLQPGFDGRRAVQGSGWYLPDGGWAWVRPRSRIRLGRGPQTRLVLDAAFWDELFGSGPRHLRVEAAGCLDQIVAVPASGTRRIVLPLRCPPSPATLPITVTLSIDAAMPRPHQLDADTRPRAFQVRRLMLEP